MSQRGLRLSYDGRFSLHDIRHVSFPVMADPELKILAKTQMSRGGVHGSRFVFKTNLIPDDFWEDLLDEEISKAGGRQMVVSFEVPSAMILDCADERLEANYSVLRQAINLANQRYVAAREAAVREWKVAEETRQSANKAATEKASKLQQRFDALEL